MKVLFTITYYHPYVSGLTIAASRFAEGLVKKGHRVTILAMRHDRALRISETIRGVRVVRATPWIRMSKGFLSWDWIRQSWRLVETHDVIVVNLPQFEGILPALLAKCMGKKVIAVYHCEVVLPKGFGNSIIQSLLEISNMGSLLLADRVVTYTKDYAKQSRLLRHIFPRLSCIVPPVLPLRAHPVMLRKYKKMIGEADAVIGIAARLSAEKGMEYLFKAIPQLKLKTSNYKFKIAVAGPMDPVGEASYKENIMSLVKQYKKRVVFLGEISPREMGSYYQCIDVLAVPSVNSTEAFGLVQVEAMLSGVPVVASNLPGVRVPITETGMGIVVPRMDTNALARAINLVIAHREDYIRSPEEIQKIFSADTSIEAFSTLL